MTEDINKLEILKLVSDLAERETDRTWSRTTAIMTLNAGLFILTSVAFQKNLTSLLIICAVLGILLAFLWFSIAVISKYYEERWHKDMEAIISNDPTLTEFVRGRNNPRCIKPKVLIWNMWRCTTSLKIIIVLIGLMWLIILLLSFSGFISN